MTNPPKILGISDLHGNLPTIENCSALLIAGDICPDFLSQRQTATRVVHGKGESQQLDWLRNEFTDWVLDLRERDIQVVWIAGNHDFIMESPMFDKSEFPGVYLRDDPYTLKFENANYNLKLWGTPWVPNLPFWAFYGRSEALEARASIIPEDLDVLIAHGPPRWYLDDVGEPHGPVGELEMLSHLDRINPMVYLCGHIHEGRGVSYRNNTVIVNASHMDENYDPNNVRGTVDLTRYIYG